MIGSRDKILIVGAYGSVGTVVTQILSDTFPHRLILAGRSKEKAQKLIADLAIEALAVQIDLGAEAFDEINFAEIHTVICCAEFLQNDQFILSCIKHQINYTELATSYQAYQRLKMYNGLAEKSGTCIIPGVGLMPGLSEIFTQDAILKLDAVRKVESFILLGLGENHGLDAIRWMMEYAGKTYSVKTESGSQQVHSFTDPLSEQLLSENHPRKFYRFNFGDQHIIANSMAVGEAHTRLAFDSGFMTWVIARAKKLGLLNKLTKIQPQTLKNGWPSYGWDQKNMRYKPIAMEKIIMR